MTAKPAYERPAGCARAAMELAREMPARCPDSVEMRKPIRRGGWLCALGVLVVVALALAARADVFQTHRERNAAGVSQGWRQWRYSRAVKLSPAPQAPAAGKETGGLAAVALPGEVRAQAQNGFADLRLVDDSGSETPFLLDRGEPGRAQNVGVAKIRETSFVPHEFTQVVLDAGTSTDSTGASARFHNGVTLATPLGSFLVAVEVAVSDDARQWRIVRDRAVIFRDRDDAEHSRRTIRYADTTARFLRLRIFNGGKSKIAALPEQFPVTAATLFYEDAQEREPAALPATLMPEVATPERPWPVWRADLGTAVQPVSEVRFEFDSARAEFHCEVRVYASDDAQDWVHAGGGQIFRMHAAGLEGYGLGTAETERVRLDNSQWRRYWRVEVRQGSCGVATRVTLYTTAWRVVFRPSAGRSYRLLYGHSLAKQPQYNLDRVLARKEIFAAAAATLGPEQTTPDWEDPRPWTERHAGMLWAAVGIAVALLGYSALRALRS